jgi:hypothetical protein
VKLSRVLVSLALFASVASVTPAASAAPGGSRPTVEHFVVNEGPFHDQILSPACGFDVNATVSIRGVDITFDRGQPSGLLFLSTFRNQVTFSANGQSVVFIERGHESVRLQNGVIVDAISGRNFGLGTIGRFVFRLDPETLEVISTSATGRPVDLARLCAALSD